VLFLLPVAAMLSTFLFERTGSVWPGAWVNGMFVTWYIVASQATHVAGCRPTDDDEPAAPSGAAGRRGGPRSPPQAGDRRPAQRRSIAAALLAVDAAVGSALRPDTVPPKRGAIASR
jgi:hypothetical protein